MLNIDIAIHAKLTGVRLFNAAGGNGGQLDLCFGNIDKISWWSGDAALAVKLAAAINEVLISHAVEKAAEGEIVPMLQAAE